MRRIVESRDTGPIREWRALNERRRRGDASRCDANVRCALDDGPRLRRRAVSHALAALVGCAQVAAAIVPVGAAGHGTRVELDSDAVDPRDGQQHRGRCADEQWCASMHDSLIVRVDRRAGQPLDGRAGATSTSRLRSTDTRSETRRTAARTPAPLPGRYVRSRTSENTARRSSSADTDRASRARAQDESRHS